MYPSEKQKIEMNNVEDMKDIANEFDIVYYHELLEKRREKEQQYELNKNLIRQDLDILKNEIMDRDNLRKLREILEFIEKNDPNYYLNLDKVLYRDIIVDIFNNFFEDLKNPSNNLIDYNLIREALKFVTYMEESKTYSKFFEIYNTQKNLKNKLKEHENSLIGKLNHIVKVKQKKRKQEINKKKKYLNEEISKEFSRRNLYKTNNLLENDYYNKKEEDSLINSIKKINNNYDLLLNEDNLAKKSILLKQEVKQEVGNSKSKIKKELSEDIFSSSNNNSSFLNSRTIDIENQMMWNTMRAEQMICDSEEEEEKSLNKKNSQNYGYDNMKD